MNQKIETEYKEALEHLTSDVRCPPFTDEGYKLLLDHFRTDLSNEEKIKLTNIIMSKAIEGFTERHIGSALHIILTPVGKNHLKSSIKYYKKIVWDYGFNDNASVYEQADNYFENFD